MKGRIKMSREFFKSITYKNSKVYTRQCSSNVNPKHFYCCENLRFTKLYLELGENGFEKWFLINGLMTGNAVVLKGSNKILRKLNYFCNLLWKDKDYRKLEEIKDKTFDKILSSTTKSDNKIAHKEFEKAKEDIEKYISSFYDNYNLNFKNIERRENFYEKI